MADPIFTTIALTGFTVAFLHAAIPTHWLPFVVTARVQHWARTKTLLITALAGSGHVLFTAILGFLVALGGIALSNEIGSYFPIIAGGALFLFGLYHVMGQLRGRGHGHSHSFGSHSHVAHEDQHDHTRHGHGAHDRSRIGHFHSHEDDGIDRSPNRSDWGAIVSLLALLTFSPCEGFVPVYVSAVRYGWKGFMLLTLILSVATVAGMIAFTWLAFAGVEKVKLQFLEKYESGLLGGLLCVLGLLIMLFEK